MVRYGGLSVDSVDRKAGIVGKVSQIRQQAVEGGVIGVGAVANHAHRPETADAIQIGCIGTIQKFIEIGCGRQGRIPWIVPPLVAEVHWVVIRPEMIIGDERGQEGVMEKVFIHIANQFFLPAVFILHQVV